MNCYSWYKCKFVKYFWYKTSIQQWFKSVHKNIVHKVKQTRQLQLLEPQSVECPKLVSDSGLCAHNARVQPLLTDLLSAQTALFTSCAHNLWDETALFTIPSGEFEWMSKYFQNYSVLVKITNEFFL